jgi:alkylation response protein AidB-like acyl-CoA dehydrogenase
MQLDDQQQKLLTMARELAGVYAQRAPERDRTGRFDPEAYELAWKAGYTKLTMAKKYGGYEVDALTGCLCQEELAQGCPATALAMAMHLQIQFQVHRVLTTEQLDALYGSGQKVLLAGGGTEEGSGGSWSALSATARKADGGWVLNGRKRFMSGALAATHFWVFLGIDGEDQRKNLLPQIGAFVVPANTKGARIETAWNAMGMRASGSDDLVLEDAFVPDNALAANSRTGFVQASRHFYFALFVEMGTYLGVARAALNRAIESVRERQARFGGTGLAPNFATQVEIGRAFTKLEAARAFIHQEAKDHPTTSYTEESRGRAAAAKYFATEMGLEIANTAMDIVGAFGFLKDRDPIERYYRDLRGGPFHPPRNFPTAAAMAGKLALGIDLEPKAPGEVRFQGYDRNRKT